MLEVQCSPAKLRCIDQPMVARWNRPVKSGWMVAFRWRLLALGVVLCDEVA